MPKASPTCRFCKFADWPRNAAGSRMISNCAGKCTYEVPPLPISMIGYPLRELPKKHYIADTDRKCDCFEAIGK